MLFRASIFCIQTTRALHPYHFNPVQPLLERDRQPRSEFCEWLINKVDDEPRFLRKILWTDEATFTRKTKCILNRQEYLWKDYVSKPFKKCHFMPKKTSPWTIKHSTFTLNLCGISFAVAGLKSIYFKKTACEPKRQLLETSEKSFNWKDLLYFVYLDLWQWIGAIIAAVCAAYINVQIPIHLGDLANLITSMVTSREVFHAIPVMKFLALYLAQAFTTFLYISLISSAGENLSARLKYNVYKSIMEQDVAFFDTKRTGELLDCLFTDVQEFKSSFKECVSQGVKNIFQITGCVISLFSISPQMSLILFGLVPSIVIGGSIFGRKLRKLSDTSQNKQAKVFTTSEEVLSNIRTVRSFSNESLECEKFQSELQDAGSSYKKLGYGIALFQAGTNLFLNGLVFGTLYLGSQYILCNDLSPGYLMSFLVTAQMMQKSFAQLSLTFGHFLKGRQAFDRICYFCSLKPSIPISGGIKIPFHSFIPTVEFQNVSFSYPTHQSQMILKDLNLILPAGKTVALVGASGNGKSTIALLLERFYDTNVGSIKINNIDIRQLDPQWLRGSVIGIISQEPILFASSIKDNIKYGKPNASDEEIYEAAKQANAHDFIMNFPDGYDTKVGERGVTISGGQKQRIAIARALIKKPSILILDEATSALDAESEKIVQETLEKACENRTVLIIAHRLSTIRNADIIAVLNKGVIVEMGTHESLIERRGAYYAMVHNQRESRNSG